MHLDMVSRSDASDCWYRNCPYAVLVYVSQLPSVLERDLYRFVREYIGLGDDNSASNCDATKETLLSGGHLQEHRPGVFSAMPTWAIQHNAEEWTIHGHTGCDMVLEQSQGLYDVECAKNASSHTFQRLFVSDQGERVLRDTNITIFSAEQILDLVPNVESLVIPEVEPDLQPIFLEWQQLSPDGSWSEVHAASELLRGVCRGMLHHGTGQSPYTHYFYHHKPGWSRLTTEEAMLFRIETASESGHSFAGVYRRNANTLDLPRVVPYYARLAAEHLGQSMAYSRDAIRVHGIALHIAEALCTRIGLHLDIVEMQ